MIKIFFLLLLLPLIAFPQSSREIIPVEIRGGSEIRRSISMLSEGEYRFLPIVESFTILGIKSTVDSTRNRITGFFRNADNTYSIDFVDSTAETQAERYTLSPTAFRIHNGIPYLNIDLYKQIFGIVLDYNPRRLSIIIRNPMELPSILAARRLRNLERLQQRRTLPEPDVTIGRDYHLISGGLLNWTLSGVVAPYTTPSARNSLNFGVKTLGGDLTGRWSNSVRNRITSNTFRGNFRYPFFGTSSIRQIIVGDMFSGGILTQEITGVEVTNRPAAIRRYFTRDLFRGNVDPGMEVAFYGGYEPPQVEKTDETGSYQFDVPVLYGNGSLELHAFDVWGQERIIRYRMTTPQSLIPPGELQYSFALGENRDRKNSPTTFTNTFDWGITPEITLGTTFSFYNVSAGRQGYGGFTGTGRLARNLILSAEVIPYAYGTGSLAMEFPSSARISIFDRRYTGTSLANVAGIVNNLNINTFLPITLLNRDFFVSILGAQTLYESQRQDEIETSVSSTFGTVTPSLTSRLVQVRQYGDGVTTQVKEYVGAVSFIMPAGLHMIVDATYNELDNKIDAIEVIGAKRFQSGIGLIFTYNRNEVLNTYFANLRLNYQFPFARAIIGGSTSGDNRFQYSAYGSGSINFNTTPLNILFSQSRGNLIGNSGFTVSAYLDTNFNGRRDESEQLVDEGKILFANKTTGGGASRISLNTKTRNKIFPYEEYSLYLDPQTLANPMWVPEYSSVSLFAEPNLNRQIEIPIVNGGIIHGSVTIAGTIPRPAEGFTILLTPLAATGDTKKSTVSLKPRTTSTFSTGEFEFLGVVPGMYMLSLDPAQIAKLAYTSAPVRRQIEVKLTSEPFLIEDQTFTLTPR